LAGGNTKITILYRKGSGRPFRRRWEDDEIGRYNLHFLDAYLVDVKTRFEDMN